MSSAPAPVILGIETSCDETGIGIVAGHRLLAHEVASSMDEHRRFGGVIPEIAARAHVEAFGPVLNRALDTAQLSLSDIDAIAVTAGPGLSGALMVGLSAAKGLALASGKPLYAVNHLVAHIAVALLAQSDHPAESGVSGELPPNCAALLVSGGHTEILQVNDLASDVRTLGATLDDAAGEAYDKVARLLGLGYPGGPVIDQLAKEGDPQAFMFPRGLTRPKFIGTEQNPGPHRYDWSFSGLKTAVARAVEQSQRIGAEVPVADIAASFQQAVIDVLSAKAVRACQEYGLDSLLLGGGVAANTGLRALLSSRCAEAGIRVMVPPIGLCTDNGAMVAALGAQLVMAGAPASAADISVEPGAQAERILF